MIGRNAPSVVRAQLAERSSAGREPDAEGAGIIRSHLTQNMGTPPSPLPAPTLAGPTLTSPHPG